jgi:Multicopper oxidase
MVTDNPGTWLFHCHVNDHFTAGMQVCFLHYCQAGSIGQE